MPDQYKWIYTKRTGQLYTKKNIAYFRYSCVVCMHRRTGASFPVFKR